MDLTNVIGEKKARRNINDHFEHIYLGGDWLGKHIDSNPHPFTRTKDYARVITYISKYLYNHNRYTFKLGGFDRDDVHSLCLTFGHAFFSLESKRDLTNFKKISSLLQHFIEQRVVSTTHKINNKFQDKEIIAIDNDENIEEETQSIIDYNEEEDEVEGLFFDESLEDDVEEEDVDINMYDYMPTTTEIKPRDKHYIAGKINEIARNPEKYATELSRYATSKYVSENIRKAARRICKQYEINPNQWATQQIENGASRHEFEFAKVN